MRRGGDDDTAAASKDELSELERRRSVGRAVDAVLCPPEERRFELEVAELSVGVVGGLERWEEEDEWD